MAASLDKWLVDRTYYNVGADMALAVYSLDLADPAATDVDELSGEWIPLPAEFADLPGYSIRAIAKLISESVILQLPSSLLWCF